MQTTTNHMIGEQKQKHKQLKAGGALRPTASISPELVGYKTSASKDAQIWTPTLNSRVSHLPRDKSWLVSNFQQDA